MRFIPFIVVLCCGFIAAKMAERKGRLVREWFAWGVIFGIITIGILLFLRTLTAAENKKSATSTRILLFLVAGLILIIFFAEGFRSQSTLDLNSAPATGTGMGNQLAETTLQVSMQDLCADYEANEVAADLKYKGHILKVSGIVSAVKKDIFGEIYVLLSTNGSELDICNIRCSFPDSVADTISSVAKG